MMVPTPRFPGALSVLLLVAVTAGLLVPAAMEPAEAAFPGANGKIAFESNRLTPDNPIPPGQPRPDSEIFAMKPDGTGIEQLTFNSVPDYTPAWSADGRWMAYASFEGSDTEIYMGSYGGDFAQTLRLTNNAAEDSDPAFSPDGSKVAFVRIETGNSEIYVMDAADADGDGNGDNQTNFTTNTANDDQPAWSPDGTKIAFRTTRNGGQSEVFVMRSSRDDPDGTPPPVNLTNNTAFDGEPNWSPDGSRIAFVRADDSNHDIYVMNADGSGQKRLTRNAAPDFGPAWSPEGTKIVFISNREGGAGSDGDIFLMRARPESRKNRPKSLTRNDLVDSAPDWRPIQ